MTRIKIDWNVARVVYSIIKAQIPPIDRRYDPKTKVWSFSDEHDEFMEKLIKQFNLKRVK